MLGNLICWILGIPLRGSSQSDKTKRRMDRGALESKARYDAIIKAQKESKGRFLNG